MPSEKDYLIGAALGAAGGFFENQKTENTAAKEREQMERQAQLLMMKEERQKMWEMRKQKDQQAFDLSKMDKEQGYKSSDAEKKRAQELFDSAEKNEFELKKLGIQNENAIKLEGVKEGTKGADKKAKARTELRKEFEKAKKSQDPFDDSGETLNFDSWAETTFPELYAEAYPDGSTTKRDKPSGSRFESIFSKVTGAASRTKKGANDSVEEPAPISVSPGGVVNSLPNFNDNRRSAE